MLSTMLRKLILRKFYKIYTICREQTIYDELMADVVRNIFIDNPTEADYNFKSSSPNLDGQIGVPPIVDKILGMQFSISSC